MVAALILGILLVVRKKRDRAREEGRDRGERDIRPHDFPYDKAGSEPSRLPRSEVDLQSKDRSYAYQHFSPPENPPQPPRSVDNLESAWFMGEGDDKQGTQTQIAKTSFDRKKIVKKTSSPKVDAEKKSANGAGSSVAYNPKNSSHTMVASDGQSSIPAKIRELPRLPVTMPTRETEHSTSPIVFREPFPPTPSIIPRPRKSSLPILPAPPVPPKNRHFNSASEDIRPTSRFSISPIARSFPSRLALPGSSSPTTARAPRSRHTRLHGFGSLPSLVHFGSSDLTQDAPARDGNAPV
ncbi:hypothetical protein B0H10DRAFT_65530 [Mycena sp. CBHHK59/15]|nr:hypothetical protein B0H10DRAFT_65530 [Mycena sp. CBHHK59/15]